MLSLIIYQENSEPQGLKNTRLELVLLLHEDTLEGGGVTHCLVGGFFLPTCFPHYEVEGIFYTSF
jgi:hypothetical protein